MTPTAETQARKILQAAQTEAFQMSSSSADVILVSHACLRGRLVVILAWQQLIFLTLQYMCIYEVVCVCVTVVLWPLIHRHELAAVPHSQSNRWAGIPSTPLRMNSANTTHETHRVFPAPSSTVTEDDKYSSVPKNQRCGTFAADWLGCDLHNA